MQSFVPGTRVELALQRMEHGPQPCASTSSAIRASYLGLQIYLFFLIREKLTQILILLMFYFVKCFFFS